MEAHRAASLVCGSQADHHLEIRPPDAIRRDPTMKPLALIEYPILNSSRQGDVVVDLFGGSGSTLLACEKNARLCRTMELDPKYSDVILQRWTDFTGKGPVRQDGARWSMLKQRGIG